MKFATLMFIFFFLVTSSNARAHSLDQDGVLRSQNGDVLFLTLQEAQSACPIGTRLSTARDLAMLSQSNGAKGILETGSVQDGNVPTGYRLIDVIDPDGKRDQFYFSPEGFKAKEEIWRETFWSSSFSLLNDLPVCGTVPTNMDCKYSLAFQGRSFLTIPRGDLVQFRGNGTWIIQSAVRCVTDE